MPEQPYQNVRQASTAARTRITPLPGEVILTRSQRCQLLADTLEAAGVPVGPLGDRLVKWLSEYEEEWVEQVCQWVRMAAQTPEGTETWWGVRYSIAPGIEPQRYPDEQDAREAASQVRELAPGEIADVVSRQVTPWRDVPEPRTCRHCGEPVIPCTPRHDIPVCKGWKHTQFIGSMPIGAHYCEGRSINPSAEPAEATEPGSESDG